MSKVFLCWTFELMWRHLASLCVDWSVLHLRFFLKIAIPRADWSVFCVSSIQQLGGDFPALRFLKSVTSPAPIGQDGCSPHDRWLQIYFSLKFIRLYYYFNYKKQQLQVRLSGQSSGGTGGRYLQPFLMSESAKHLYSPSPDSSPTASLPAKRFNMDELPCSVCHF